MAHIPPLTSKLVRYCIAITCVVGLLVSSQAMSLARSHVVFPKGVNALVTMGKPGSMVPSNYLGISLEMSGLCNFLQTEAATPTKLENLFKDLGAGVLKVGGKSSDYANWKPTGTPVCSEKGTVLTQSEVDSLFTFADHAGVQVYWGLPLIKFNPTAAAAQAKAVAAIGGSRLAGFMIGNEPDIYVGAGMRPKTWLFPQYWSQWKQTQQAVVKAAPGVHIVSPELCCNNGMFKKFANAAKGYVSAVSFHMYTGSAQKYLTVAHLLSSTLAANLAGRTKTYLKADAHLRVPLWITETNTFPKGGVKGISDRYISAFWLGDMLFQQAGLGVGQVEVQQIDGLRIYDPIRGVAAQPMPIFYGLLFYHSAVPAGAHLLATKLKTSSKKLYITTYANKSSAGVLNVILFNKGSSAVNAQVTADKAYKSASYYRFQAPSLTSKTVTIGGASIQPDGTIPGPTSSTSSLSQKLVTTVTVPAGSAICVSFQP